MQFTIGQETHDKLRRLQALMRREIPSGDPAVIFDQAVDLLLQKVERAKLGAKANPSRPARPGPAANAYEERIRFRTDDSARSRKVPNPVKRAVWRRDGGQCAFVSPAGQRCTERAFLELHHIQPYALDGPTTVRNISLHCRRHNAYEAELAFSPRTVGRSSRKGDCQARPT